MATMLSHYMQEEHGGEESWVPFSVVPVPDPAGLRSVNAITAVGDCTMHVFAAIEGSEEEIYPPTINEIAQEQRLDRNLGKFFRPNTKVENKERFFSLRVIDSTEVIVYKDTRLVVPMSLQAKVVQWYHHYLIHPGHTRIEETIAATLYWRLL